MNNEYKFTGRKHWVRVCNPTGYLEYFDYQKRVWTHNKPVWFKKENEDYWHRPGDPPRRKDPKNVILWEQKKEEKPGADTKPTMSLREDAERLITYANSSQTQFPGELFWVGKTLYTRESPATDELEKVQVTYWSCRHCKKVYLTGHGAEPITLCGHYTCAICYREWIGYLAEYEVNMALSSVDSAKRRARGEGSSGLQ